MTHYIWILMLLFITNVSAQTFKPQVSTNRVDMDVCQSNQNFIFNTMIKKADSQIARLLNGIQEEEKYNRPEDVMMSYKELLVELVMKRLFLNELKKQLNNQKLAEFYLVRENYNKDILMPDKIIIDLENQFAKTLKSVAKTHELQFSERRIDDLNSYLLTTTLTQFALQRGMHVISSLGSNILLGFVSIKGGKLILKTLTAGIGRAALTSAGIGLVLNIMALPLKGSRLPAEDVWLQVLKEYPELIMIPDAARAAKLQDHPWMSHCYALARRTKSMEKVFAEVIKGDEAKFLNQVREINDRLYQSEEKKDDDFLYRKDYYKVQQDNTRVYIHKPIDSFAPLWATKL
jgi:hypothetical protein